MTRRRAPRFLQAWTFSAAFAIAACSTPEPVIAPAHDPARADHPLSRAECIDLALACAPTAAAWEARLAVAQAALRSAQTLPNPPLLLEWENLGLDHGPTPTPVQTTASLLIPLAELLAMPWRIDAAEFDLAAEQARIAAEHEQLAAAVCRQRVLLLGARRQARALAARTQIAKDAQAGFAEFARVGVLPPAIVDRAAAEVLAAAAEEATATRAARALEIEFCFALGFDRPLPLDLYEAPDAPGDGTSIPHSTSAPAAIADREALFLEAAMHRAEIAAAAAAYRATLERQRLADTRIELLPTIGVGARKQGDVHSEIASIEVNLPLFDQGGVAVDGASAELYLKAAALRTAARDVTRDVAVAYDRWLGARTFEQDHAAPLLRARAALRDGMEALFAAGETTFEELIQVRRDQAEAQIAALDARLSVELAAVDLDAALARLTRASLPADR